MTIAEIRLALNKAVESGVPEDTEVEVFTGSRYLYQIKELKPVFSKIEKRPALIFTLT